MVPSYRLVDNMQKIILSKEYFVMIISVVIASILSMMSAWITSRYMMDNQIMMLKDKNQERKIAYLSEKKSQIVNESEQYCKLINEVIVSIRTPAGNDQEKLKKDIEKFNSESITYLITLPQEMHPVTIRLNQSIFALINYQRISDLEQLQSEVEAKISDWYRLYFEIINGLDIQIQGLYDK